MKKAYWKTRRGFTLIELLIVIAIIGILSSIVLVSLSSARNKAKDTAVKAEARQFANLIALEFTETGSYTALQSGWDNTASECNNSFSGNQAATARAACVSIVNKGSVMYSGNQFDNVNRFSVMARLPGTGLYYCIGSSGGTSDQGLVNGTWSQTGCYSNP